MLDPPPLLSYFVHIYVRTRVRSTCRLRTEFYILTNALFNLAIFFMWTFQDLIGMLALLLVIRLSFGMNAKRAGQNINLFVKLSKFKVISL
jgi:hypothetical protein